MKLENAHLLATRHPRTFRVPSAAELAAIAPGDFVKLCAEGERFWVEVMAVSPGVVIGRVANDLVRTDAHGLRFDSVIAFFRNNVFAIERSRT